MCATVADDACGGGARWSALRTALEHEHRLLADAAPHRARATPPIAPTRSAPDLTASPSPPPPQPTTTLTEIAPPARVSEETVRETDGDAVPDVGASAAISAPVSAVASPAVADAAAEEVVVAEVVDEAPGKGLVCPCCGVRLVLVQGVLREAVPVPLPPPRALDPLATVPAAVWRGAIAVLFACVLAAVLAP